MKVKQKPIQIHEDVHTKLVEHCKSKGLVIGRYISNLILEDIAKSNSESQQMEQ